MGGCQLRCILDADDAFPGIDRTECGGQQCGLARPGATGDQERQSGGDDAGQQAACLRRYRAGGFQGCQVLGRRPQHAQR